MNEYTQQAIERLDNELKSGSFDKYGKILVALAPTAPSRIRSISQSGRFSASGKRSTTSVTLFCVGI